ncbi:hypothetical protein FACS1894214_4390 [Planctomycetales bacterium]|nr:hypothetical protein FACS1894214_4390 [Planctomycetales bacterium]
MRVHLPLYCPFGFGPYSFGPGWLSKHAIMNTIICNPICSALHVTASLERSVGLSIGIKKIVIIPKNHDAPNNSTPDSPFRIALCRFPVLGRIAVQGLNLFSLGTVRTAIAERKHLSPEAVSGLLAPYNSWANRTAVYRFVQDIPLSPSHPSYNTLKNIEEALPSFTGKNFCFIWGMLDWCFSPDFLKRYLQFFPDAAVFRFENAHHLVVEDAPDEVIAAMKEFLSKR